MGWLGSNRSKMEQWTSVFVPVWGWVGSSLEKEYKGGFSESSSPSGDGLVPFQLEQMTLATRFSSPSGDGLVLSECSLITLERSFRPRLGMGWFQSVVEGLVSDKGFSSPSGDGLVRWDFKRLDIECSIFVPAWGWVGSPQVLLQVQWNLHFRPRVGMGWFYSHYNENTCCNGFSSPLGDGLVLRECMMIAADSAFSSPSGDGLVQETEFLITRSKKIFVPAWGWVGSWLHCNLWNRFWIFVPEWGWVGSP